jgi:imidazolonepropionase-like amidohydrolase
VAPYNTWRELVYEVDRLGISPAEALRVATMGNARLLGIEGEVGSVAAGKSADLIVMDENPLEDLRRLERIGGVFIRGRHIDKPAIKKNRAIDEALDSLSNGEKGAKA